MPLYVGDALIAHAQGGCYRCHRGDRLVDTDAQIEGEGVLAICVSCIEELAEAAGLQFNAAAVAEMRASFDEERRRFAPERIAELEAQLAEKSAALLVSQQVEARLQAALAHVDKPRKAAPKAA